MTPRQFRAARLAIGLTTRELAARFGVTSRAVEKWESGVNPIRPREELALKALPAEVERCSCTDFVKAQQLRTDNEGYGALIMGHSGEWFIGHDLPPLAFCPWCGRLAPPKL